MADVELADELAELVGQLKHQLGRHYAAGTWAVPGGAMPRVERVTDHDAIPHQPAGDVPRMGR